jgi:hypothetical protein
MTDGRTSQEALLAASSVLGVAVLVVGVAVLLVFEEELELEEEEEEEEEEGVEVGVAVIVVAGEVGPTEEVVRVLLMLGGVASALVVLVVLVLLVELESEGEFKACCSVTEVSSCVS